MQRSLLYRVLGPVEVAHDGRPVDLGGPKQRLVLAVLLLEAGRVVSIDRLAHLLWGEDPPSTAVATIQAYISKLRRALRTEASGTSPITRSSQGYVLIVPDQQIDSHHFLAGTDAAREAVRLRDWPAGIAAAQQALAWWRGEPFGELADEHWVQAEVAALRERRNECTEYLITALLGANRIAEALIQAGALAGAAPLSERSCWLHMLVLHRAGRSGEALAAYRAFAAVLDEELGLEPGPALREVQAAILRQDADLQEWPNSQKLNTFREGFVGRAHELLALDEALEVTLGGGSAWLLLSGPAGIGKSRLAEEAMTQARAAGVQTVRVSCPEDEGLPPWWPVRALLRSLGADVDAVFARPHDLEADAARFAIADRVQTELDKLSRTQPLLIVVDDVQWADAASLRFLTNLTTTASLNGFAVILTVRDGQLRPDVQRLLAATGRRAGARQLALPALTPEQVAALVEHVSGEDLAPEQARLLTERTGGNPFFISEYARLPAADRAAGQVPAGVRAVLNRRLSTTDPAVLNLLRHAAIMGDQIDVDLLGAVTHEPVDRLADALDTALEAGMIIVSPSTGAYVFAHGLLREEVLLGIPPVRRQRLHARVADALTDAPDHRSRRAGHLVAALPFLPPTPVYEACRTAALDAETRWDSDSASHWWGTALHVFARLPIHPGSDDERDHLVEAQVEALARAGRDQQVLDVVDEALLVAGREGRVRSLGRLAGGLLRTAGGWPWVGYTSDPGPLITRLASVEPLVRADPSAQARVLAAMAVGSCYDPDESRREDLSARAIACAEASGDNDALADALLARAVVFSGVITRVEEVRDLLLRLGQVPHAQARIDEVLSHNMLSWVQMTLGDVDAAEEHRRLGVGGCDLLRLPVARTQLRWAEGAMAQWHGDLDAAAAIFEHAYELHRETQLYSSGVYDIALIGLRWDRDGFRTPVPLREVDRTSGPWARVATCVATGQMAEADRLIGLELAARPPAVWTTYGKLTMLAHLVADIGAEHHAHDLISRLTPIAHCIATIGHVGLVGPVALAVARLHHLLGETTAALAQLAVATELARRTDGLPSLRRCQALAMKINGVIAVPPKVATATTAQTSLRLDLQSAAGAPEAR